MFEAKHVDFNPSLLKRIIKMYTFKENFDKL